MRLIKNALAFILAAVFALSSAYSVFAEGNYDPQDPYIYDYVVGDDDYDGPRYQYTSPYVTDYIFDNKTPYTVIYVFSLYNTVTHEVVPAYCTDINVSATANRKYRRKALEESTYAASAAGLLRAIVNEGFYLPTMAGETDAQHRVRVEEELKTLGEAAGVPDLTIGEAISATQTAIWKAAHGSRLEFPDFFRTVYTNNNASLTRYYDLCSEELKNGHAVYTTGSYGHITIDPECDAKINARIKKVHDYLLALKPVSAQEKMVSPSSFTELSKPVVSNNGDGTCDVSVTATVDVSVSSGDDLTLSAVIDDTHFNSVSLKNGEQTVIVTINDVPEDIAYNEVTLAIDGNQTISEPVLFEAKGGREDSQSMVGAERSRAPVSTRVIANDNRILNFYKTTLVSNGSDTPDRFPLEGIIFDIYHVATYDEYVHDTVELPAPEDYVTSGLPDFIAVTDVNGRASINLTQHGYTDGVYLVVERAHKAIESPVAPFYAVLPIIGVNGNYEYEITLQPKNDVKGDIKVDKDITAVGNNKDSVNAYENHKWIISTGIPEDISHGKSFKITDTFDNRLDFLGNLKVNVENPDGSEAFLTLDENEDYVLTVNDVDSLGADHPSDSFVFELTREGMEKLGDFIEGKNVDDYMLRLHFDAQINANAHMGTDIPNSALLEYVNSVNFEFKSESDEPTVSVGGINLLKVDSKEQIALEGAVFEVYRPATVDEILANDERITHIEGITAPVIRVSFFNNSEMRGERVTEVTSNENGEMIVYGLAYGTYYLVETKAPDGYVIKKEATEIKIDELSHTIEGVATVDNVRNGLLPNTGGIGTTVFTVSGIVLVLVAILLLVWKKYKA